MLFDLVGYVFTKPVRFYLESKMTALAICYVLPGFCLAADGRVISDMNNMRTVTSDCTQKIFTTTGKDFCLAYTMSGEMMSDDFSYNLVTETAQLTSRLSSKPFSCFADYSHKFGEKLKRRLNAFKKDGKLNPYPNPNPVVELHGERERLIVEVSVIGYFFSAPVWTTFQFVHEKQRVGLNLYKPSLRSGQNYANGSTMVPEAVVKGDSRLSKYHDHLSQPADKMSSLEDAANYVMAYVGACCDPCSKEIDPACGMMGGHIHLAEVTPSGFRWRIPPK
jgi:hypothetical protein